MPSQGEPYPSSRGDSPRQPRPLTTLSPTRLQSPVHFHWGRASAFRKGVALSSNTSSQIFSCVPIESIGLTSVWNNTPDRNARLFFCSLEQPFPAYCSQRIHLHKAAIRCYMNRFSAAGNPQLLQDMCHVNFDGRLTNVKGCTNLLVALAFAHRA